MRKLVRLSVVLVALFFLSACAPRRSSIFIIDGQNILANYSIECNSTLVLVAGQKAVFSEIYELKAFSGDIIVRKNVETISSSRWLIGTQIDTYAEGEGSVTFDLKGTKCTIKVIVKPSPYTRPTG